ncbi:MAG: cation diffusion facilitator CzcD-associated flavoprotein CzcO, partial [Myxococcota bacterium]
HLFFRRPKLPNINTYRWAEFVGFLKHHGDLSDADRWRFIHRIVAVGQLPPTDTYFRAKKHPNFHLHPASPWNSVEELGDHARVITPHGTHDLDFLIIGTGFRTNLHQRPEWANLCDHVALWQDRYTPPAELSQADLGRHPYLGPNFELTEREPGSAPWLHKVFNYTFGCLVSLGFGGASISGMKYGQQRLIDGITRRLYIEDAAQHFESLEAFDLEEFTP